MKPFIDQLEVPFTSAKEKAQFLKVRAQIDKAFGGSLYINQFNQNRKNLMIFLENLVQALNKRIEARDQKPFKGNYRKLSNIPQENLKLFGELKNNPEQFDKFFQMQARRGLEQLSLWNTGAKDLNLEKVDQVLSEACETFKNGLNQDNLSDLEFFLTNSNN